MRKKYLFKKTGFLFLWILWALLGGGSVADALNDQHVFINEADTRCYHVLIINSYHKGYKWSDDIVKGIEDHLQGDLFSIRTEYMDTKRIADSRYLDELAQIYRYKFAHTPFDLVISSDDTAFNFVREHHDTLFQKAPVMACGLNAFDPEKDMWPYLRAVVPERYDIKGTLNAALMIHPETDIIYVINDTTPTGKLIQQKFNAVRSRFEGRITFVPLEGGSMQSIEETLANAPDNSLGLLLVYFRDADGRYYQPDQAARRITEHARIPIYGVWDFYMNHGIVGGVLTRGYGQGAVVGEAARAFLSGLPEKNPVFAALDVDMKVHKPNSTLPFCCGPVQENTRGELPMAEIQKSGNALFFDYNVLKRFNIPLSKISRKGTILNMKYHDQKNILILNAYDEQLKWTRDIVAGMTAVFDEMPYRKRIYVEYMDTKNFPLPETYSHLLSLYRYKYTNVQFDLILTSDDNAFDFALKNRLNLFHGAPLVFCGVNYLEEDHLQHDRDAVTGVVESLDIRGTVELMRKLHPDMDRLLVINDQSSTGVANKKRVMAELPASIKNKLSIEFTPLMKMTELQRKLEGLHKKTLILLMTFNRDQNNDTFSYQESIDLISQFTQNPIYSVWDFYLGRGIVGGMLASGREQGRRAALMGLEILSGRSPGEIAIVRNSEATPMFDGHYLKQFDISEKKLPAGHQIINRQSYFQDRHRMLFIIGGGAFIVLAVCTIILYLQMRSQKKFQKKLEIKANFDPLTQLLNRSAGMAALKKMVEQCNRNRTKMVLCFVDIDRLKFVNDTLGHTEGDRYIRLVAESLKASIRRDRDVSARIGGDEFLLLLYNHGLDGAEIIVQRIRERLAEKDGSSRYPYPIGASFGMAVYNSSMPCSVDALIDRADAEMYLNKEARRSSEKEPK